VSLCVFFQINYFIKIFLKYRWAGVIPAGALCYPGWIRTLTWAVFNRKCWLWLVIESNLVRLSGFISLALFEGRECGLIKEY